MTLKGKSKRKGIWNDGMYREKKVEVVFKGCIAFKSLYNMQNLSIIGARFIYHFARLIIGGG